MRFRDKVFSEVTLLKWRKGLRGSNQTLVVTNGCFDILHLGHVTYLEEARTFGDKLLVGINSDDSVRKLKGPNRPINSEIDRALVVAALESVSGVFIFNSKNALQFLELAMPDYYIKGGDYTIESINQEERLLIEKMGAKIEIVSGVKDKSTSNILNKIQ